STVRTSTVFQLLLPGWFADTFSAGGAEEVAMKVLARCGPCALVLGIAVYYLLTSPVHMGDTAYLVRGVEAIRRSLATWTPPVPPLAVGHFPLYQFLFGLVFSSLGASEHTSLDLFCVLSFLAFAGCILLTGQTLRRRSPAVAAAAALVLATGPLLWY